MKKLLIFTDGGAINNPGPAAVGVVVKDENGKILTSFGGFVGKRMGNFLNPLLNPKGLRFPTLRVRNHFIVAHFTSRELFNNKFSPPPIKFLFGFN